MKNCNDHFVFDFADAVVIRESVGDICVGEVRAPQGEENPSVTARVDGDKLALDFVIPFMFVDDEVSDTSNNAVGNAAVKKYIDGKCPVFKEIFADISGRFSFEKNGSLAEYDLLICLASAWSGGSPTCFPVPIKYCSNIQSYLDILVSDENNYTTFRFTYDGCTSVNQNSEYPGRFYGLYGIKF